MLAVLAGCTFSEGERAGTVVKLSRKGLFFKTYEGELATLAAGQTGTMTSNTFRFTVDNEEVADKIREAMNTGSRVNITYEEVFFTFPWEGDTNYFVKNVSVLKRAKEPTID